MSLFDTTDNVDIRGRLLRVKTEGADQHGHRSPVFQSAESGSRATNSCAGKRRSVLGIAGSRSMEASCEKCMH